MKKSIAIAAAAVAMTLAYTPANAGMTSLKTIDVTAGQSDALLHKTGRRGRAIAAGIALGVIGAVAASRYHRPRC